MRAKALHFEGWLHRDCGAAKLARAGIIATGSILAAIAMLTIG